MKIIAAHSYLVYPDKSAEEPRSIRGTSVTSEEGSFNMLQQIFDEAPRECRYDISFSPTENGAQKNTCRDLFLAYVKSPDLDVGHEIAERLRGITTKRSGLGLLFLILGKEGASYRFVVSRFPADQGILAEEAQHSLTVQFIERIFMKNATAYKSAVYEGAPSNGDFWKGRAIDKQIDSEIIISNYWIRDFLLSDFATTGERGTRRLASALREAVNKSSDIEVKEDITAAVRLSNSFDKKVTSASDFCTRVGLSDEATEAVKEQIKDKLIDEQFVFLHDEFSNHVKFKSIELDNGARLTAQSDEFDEVFTRSKEYDTNKVRFSTTGEVVDEKFRKRK